MTIRRLGPSSYWLLEPFVSSEPRDPWVQEAEDFLTEIAPTGTGDARGSTIVLISNDEGTDVAAAAFRPHPQFYATLIQCFVVHPQLRGRGHAVSSFTELRDTLSHGAGESHGVTWAVRNANVPMLRLSARVGQKYADDDGLTYFIYP